MNKSGSIKKGRFSVSQGKVGYNTSSTKKGRFNVSKGTEGFNTTPIKKSSKNPKRRILNNNTKSSKTNSGMTSKKKSSNKSSSKHNNRLTSDENFIMTKNEMMQVKMYMKLKNKIPLNDILKKEIKSINKELDILMKNKYFNPFKTSVSMVPFTRWTNDESTKPQNKIYVFTQKKYQILLERIRNTNKAMTELLQQKINRAVIKYNKIRKNEYIRSIYKKIETLRKKLDKYNYLIPKDLDIMLEKIKELNKFGSDTGRRLN